MRDGADEIESSSSFKDSWDDIKVLKLASIMELFSLPDCAIELISAAHQKGLLRSTDTNQLTDLLVANVAGDKVSYNQYLENLKTIKRRGYVNTTQHARLLFARFVPLSIRLKVGNTWIRLKKLIDEILI